MPALALYSPDLPPCPGGVADHTLALARALERLGTPPAVLGLRGAPTSFSPLACVTGIGIADLPAAAVRAGVKHVVIQYVPFLYARRGVAPLLPLAVRRLKRAGLRVSVFVHEPFVPYARLVWLLTGPLQRIQLRLVLRHAWRVFTPAPAFGEMARRHAPASLPIRIVPSGAVLPISTADRESARRALGLADDRVVVGVFSPAASGFSHQWIAAAASRLRPRRDVTWVVFGFGSDRRWPGYPDGADALRLGDFPEPHQPGRVMRALDLALAPYADGLTLRRTGALLAIAHGVPTVSSRGPLFDPVAGELAECLPDAAAFAERVHQLVEDRPARRALAARTERYAETASPDAAARIMMAELGEGGRA